TEFVSGPGAVAFTPDGGKQLRRNAERLNLHAGTAEGVLLARVSMHLLAGVFSADGRTCWALDNQSAVKAWDVSGPAPRELYALPPVGQAAFPRLSLHRNDTVLACASGGRLTFWDLTRSPAQPLSTFPAQIAQAYVFPDAERVLVRDQNAPPQLWAQTKGRWEKVWEDATVWSNGPWYGTGTLAAAHPSGKWVAVACQPPGGFLDRTELTLRRSSDGKVVWKCPLRGIPYDVTFAPDGRHLFVANGFNTVYVLRLNELVADADS